MAKPLTIAILLFTCAIVVFVCCSPVLAQSAYAVPTHSPSFDPGDVGRPPLRLYTDRDGLPQNAITALAYDPRNYLWVGTKDGAAFFNGRTWTVVNIPTRNNTNWVACLLVASDGSVWVGTVGGGLLNFRNGQWIQYNTGPDPLDNEIRCLAESHTPDGESIIWAGSGSDLFKVMRGEVSRLTLFSDGDLTVKCLKVTTDPDGSASLWIGSNQGAVRLHGESRTYFGTSDGLTELRVEGFLDSTAFGERSLLVCTYGNGIYRFDGQSWAELPQALECPDPNLTSMFETKDAEGQPVLWAGSASGVERFSRGRWVSLHKTQGIPGSVWCFLSTETLTGTRTLWLGTAGYGLLRMEQGRWTAFDTTTGLPDNSTYAVMVSTNPSGDRTLWVGTNDGGLAVLERGRWTTYARSSELKDTSVLCLTEATSASGERSVWVGLHARGLAHFRNGTWTTYEAEQGLPGFSVTCLYETTNERGARGLWVGTNNGLAWMEDGVLSTPQQSRELVDPRVRVIYETTAADGARTLWVGTEGGLAQFHNGQVTRYDTSNGLPNSVITAITEVVSTDGQRWLWVGTRGGGAAVRSLDRPSDGWRVVSTKTLPELPNNTIYRVLQDAEHRLYLCTNKGVARLTETGHESDGFPVFSTYVFMMEDGLPSNECNTGASFIDDLGRLWVGTIGGVAMLDTTREIVDSTPKPLRIERTTLVDAGRSLESGARLEYFENHILFEFALLSYFRETDISYQTQLVGFDPVPSPWGRDFKKEYTSLPKGSYVFRVWGRDDVGNISGPVEISFVIEPAPWFTLWAYVLYILALAGLGYLIVRHRLRTLRMRTEMLEDRIMLRTAELGQKVQQLGLSERNALDARNAAIESEFRARESERKALEASRAKSVFLANMSHELRTPLNAILGFVQLMERDRTLTEEQRGNLGVIMRSGEHLLALINDVLSLSKIEAGRVVLNVHAFDLLRLLQGLEEMFRLRAEMKQLQLIVDIASALPQFVIGDEAKLRQVLINLLGNAVKFTRVGHIALRAKWRDDRAYFEVEDTGPGIAPDEMNKLFQAFVQTQTGHQSTEGTGLGLAISRNYVVLMDGHISVESDPGHGTVFRVEIHLPTATDMETHNSTCSVVGLEPGEPKYRLLVVDDVEENRVLLVKLLTSVGFDVQQAANGREALDLWSTWAPDLVFMDMRMPVMDGLEATIRIRRAERQMSTDVDVDEFTPINRCKIIALTASAFDHDRTEILSSGCDDFIPKPFREAHIFEKLELHLGSRFMYEDAREPASTRATAKVDGAVQTADRLAQVPPETLAALGEAVTIGDVEAALKVAETIGNGDETLTTELRTLIRKYRFDELLGLIESVAERRK